MTARKAAPATPKASKTTRVDACVVQSEDVDATGGTALVAFPGQGLASTLATAYLADALSLRTVGRLDCTTVPALAIVEAGTVIHPMRVLFGQDRRAKSKAHPLVVFLSEVALDEANLRPVAATVLAWCKANGVKSIISMEGAASDGLEGEASSIQLWGVSNSAKTNKRLAAAKLAMAREGVIGGLTGALLDLGLDDDLEVIALVAVGGGLEPDVRAASRLVEFLAKFLALPVPLTPLRRETERFERHLKDIERRRKASQPEDRPDPQEFI
ncbi:MAG: proteasome assembly chaperone family protein [Thermoplasmatota archaeon]